VVLANTLRALDRERYDPLVVTGLPAEVAQEVFGGLGVPVILHRYCADYVQYLAFLGKPWFVRSWQRRLASYGFTLYAAVVNSLPLARLTWRIARLKPCLIHTHNAIDSMLIATLLRIPAVLHLHGPFGEQSRLEVAMVKRSRKCICVSRGIADMLIQRGVDSGKLVVMANPSPLPQCDLAARDTYRDRFAPAPDEVLVAHIGRLAPWKGQKEFLLAFARVARHLPGIKALIVGDDIEKLNGAYVEELHSLIRQEGLSERVFCTGQIKDIHNLVAAVDLVVHSSTEPEPFGLVVTEAMALAKPVVAANYGATAEIVEHGRTGLLADPHNAQELAAAIARLAADRSLRLAYGQAALEKARLEYSLDRYRTQLEAIYDEIDA